MRFHAHWRIVCNLLPCVEATGVFNCRKIKKEIVEKQANKNKQKQNKK
jgi:hypothetical protein